MEGLLWGITMIGCHKFHVAIFCAVCLPAWGFPASEAATYTTINVPGAGTSSGQGTDAYSVNDLGAVAGSYEDGNGYLHGFLLAPDGTFSTFDAQGSQSQTLATAMNAKGAIVGYYGYPDSNGGFLHTAGGKTRTFDGCGAGTQATFIFSINDSGVIPGDCQDTDLEIRAFIRAKDGTITQFEAPDAGEGMYQGTDAFGINNVGEITGPYIDANNVGHSYVRSADGHTIVEFDAPGAGTNAGQGTFANSINRQGSVTGPYYDANNVGHGFVRLADGSISTFDVADAGQGDDQGTFAVSINKHGMIAGVYVDSDNVSHGFVRSNAGTVKAFDAPGAGTDPGQGTTALFINDNNIVVGYFQDSNGVYHGFLRKP